MAVEGGGSYLDRGSNGVQVLRARALFRSGGGGLGMGRAQRTLVPLALSRSCLGLDPYLPRGSNGVRPQHQEPRSRALAYSCQHSSSDHPAPFLRAPPPSLRGWAACACADPFSRPAFPTKAFLTRSPVRMRFRQWVGGVGGVFSFPPDSPHRSPPPPPRPRSQARALTPCTAVPTHPSYTLSPPTFADRKSVV